jgi:hypothetical protein
MRLDLRASLAAGLVAALAAGCGGGGGSGGSGSAAAGISAGGTFTNVSPLGRARVYHTATLLKDGRILITGGLVGPQAATAEVELLDPSTGAITSAAPMSVARMAHEAVLLPTQKVLVVGGQSTRFGVAHATTELYDPLTNTWSAGPNLSTGRAAPTVSSYDQGKKVLIAGGFTYVNNQPTVHTSVDIYSGDSNTIAASTRTMTQPRCDGEAYTQQNGQILFTSGYRSLATADPALSEVYDITNDLFIPVNQLEARAEASLAVIDSKIHGIGGVTSAAVSLASVEQFDGQTWSAAARPLLRPRDAFTATTVGKNAVVIGGRENGAVLGSVELYPAGIASVGSHQLAEPRYRHTATAVGDRVYVIGGFTTNEDILASVEVWSTNPSAVPGAGAGKGTRVSGKASAGGTQLTLNPTSGAIGATVEITGTGFSSVASANIVRFNGVQAIVTFIDVTVPSANRLRALVPAGATTGAVTVEVGGVVATGPIFTVGSGTGTAGPPPRILLVLPNSASRFIPVSITGQDFGSQPVVTFNGVPTINIVNLSTKTLPFIGSISELIVIVPPGATSGPLVVTNGTQQSNPFYFTVR